MLGVMLGSALQRVGHHLQLDHLGSVRVVTNQSGDSISEHEYYPFGVTKTRTYQEQINWGDPHLDSMRFAGHWRDFLGLLNVENTEYLDYMHARHYDPNIGRFLSVDPEFDLEKMLGNPQMWNRYSYVVNNPIRYTDPDGREHVQEPGFTKPMTAENLAFDENTPAVIKGAFYAEGLLLAAGAASEAGLFTLAKEGLAAAGEWVVGRAAASDARRASSRRAARAPACRTKIARSESADRRPAWR